MDHRERQKNRGKSASQNGSAHVPPQIRPTGHLLQRATASRRARLPAQRAMQTRNMTAGCKGTQPTTARTKQTGFRVLSFKSQTISPEETSATSTRAYASAAADSQPPHQIRLYTFFKAPSRSLVANCVSACVVQETYSPPSHSLNIRGFPVGGTAKRRPI